MLLENPKSVGFLRNTVYGPPGKSLSYTDSFAGPLCLLGISFLRRTGMDPWKITKLHRQFRLPALLTGY